MAPASRGGAVPAHGSASGRDVRASGTGTGHRHQASGRAVALAKQLVNASPDGDRTTAFAVEAAAQEISMTTRDAKEGVASFVERRSPEYEGR
ncbi:hypothetical protein [Streptomyces globisporus]|uniref:hypothetical protein n=1 Tax=Streptomyces globisporus TaxID=1908 RepID=UPI003673B88D